jgi:hypothetical protein
LSSIGLVCANTLDPMLRISASIAIDIKKTVIRFIVNLPCDLASAL